jgi:simple sugar transport system permease protein
MSVPRRVLRAFLVQRELTPVLITIGLFVYFWARAGSTFTSSLSLSSAAGYAGPIGAIAVGEVMLLVLAEIDLSAGQVFLFAPWLEFWFNGLGIPILPSILLALLVCCGVGLINGLLTVRLQVPSFVATLAMNFVLFGIVLIYSDDAQASPIPLSAAASNPDPAIGSPA